MPLFSPRGNKSQKSFLRTAVINSATARIPNLQLWLDASRPSLYDSVSGGSLVTTPSSVFRWEDLSGNNRHFTKKTQAGAPQLAITSSGERGLSFTAATSYNDANAKILELPSSSWPFTGPYTLVAVYTNVSGGSIFSKSTDAAKRRKHQISYDGGGLFYSLEGAGDVVWSFTDSFGANKKVTVVRYFDDLTSSINHNNTSIGYIGDGVPSNYCFELYDSSDPGVNAEYCGSNGFFENQNDSLYYVEHQGDDSWILWYDGTPLFGSDDNMETWYGIESGEDPPFGGQVLPNSNFALAQNNSAPVYIGASPFQPNSAYNAEACINTVVNEIMFFDRALSDFESQSLVTRLRLKYRI